MSRRIIPIYYVLNLNKQVAGSETGSGEALPPYVYYKENPLIQLHLLESEMTDEGLVYTPYDGLSESFIFSAVIDTDYTNSTVHFCKTFDSNFNIETDWDDISIPDGRICLRLNLNTVDALSRIGTTAAFTTTQLEIQAHSSGTNPQLVFVARFPIYVYNLMDKPAWIPVEDESGTPEYNSTAASTTEITMLADYTDRIIEGSSVLITFDDEVDGTPVADVEHIGTVVSITSNLLTISGVTLPTGAGEIHGLDYEYIGAPLSNYYTKTEIDALLSTGFTPSKIKGDWAVGTSYDEGDSVIYKRSTWVALQASLGDVPDTSPLYWVKMAEGSYPFINTVGAALLGAF